MTRNSASANKNFQEGFGLALAEFLVITNPQETPLDPNEPTVTDEAPTAGKNRESARWERLEFLTGYSQWNLRKFVMDGDSIRPGFVNYIRACKSETAGDKAQALETEAKLRLTAARLRANMAL